MVGIPNCANWQRGRSGHFISDWPNDRAALAATSSRKSKSLHVLEPAVEREGWKLILLSQLHPLFPTSLMNYLYGLTKIRFRTCMIWIAIGQAPGLFLYAYLGTLGQLGLRLARGQTHPRMYEYWVWGGGLLISLAILVLMGRIALRVLRGVATA